MIRLANVEAMTTLNLHEEADDAPRSNRGLTLLPSAQGHVITSEMVAEALADE